MRLGVLVESEDGLTWERWRDIAATVDGLGFDSLWVSDHFLTPSGEDRQGIEAWTALTLAAAETRHVQLGPLVSPIMFRPPGVVARMALGIHSLSGGRLVIGLGAGWNVGEHHAFGIPFPPPRERLRLLEAGVQQIRGVSGVRDVPILIGGMGERLTLPVVARCADEWNLTTADPALVERKSRVLAELGRDPRTIRRSVSAGLLIGRDAAELERRGRALQRLVPQLAAVSLSEVPAAARAMGWLVGTPGEVVASLRDLGAAGVDRTMLGHYDQDDADALALVAREVLPALAS